MWLFQGIWPDSRWQSLSVAIVQLFSIIEALGLRFDLLVYGNIIFQTDNRTIVSINSIIPSSIVSYTNNVFVCTISVCQFHAFQFSDKQINLDFYNFLLTVKVLQRVCLATSTKLTQPWEALRRTQIASTLFNQPRSVIFITSLALLPHLIERTHCCLIPLWQQVI